MKRTTLNDLIRHYDRELNDPNLDEESRRIAQNTLRELQGKKSIVEFLNDTEVDGKKFCWRYCMRVVDSCEVCEYCLSPDDLANNGDE